MQRIIVTVFGGVAEVEPSTIPEGIEVEIRDYDILDKNESTKTDNNGDYYNETLWSHVE